MPASWGNGFRRSFIVGNRPGAAGTIGVDSVVRDRVIARNQVARTFRGQTTSVSHP
jgi:hypothetical protein